MYEKTERKLSEIFINKKSSWLSFIFILPALHLLSAISKQLDLSGVLEGIVLNWRNFFRIIWEKILSLFAVDINFYSHEYDALTFSMLSVGVVLFSKAKKNRMSLKRYVYELHLLAGIEKIMGVFLPITLFLLYVFIFGLENISEKLSSRQGIVFLVAEFVIIFVSLFISLFIWFLSKRVKISKKILFYVYSLFLGGVFFTIFGMIFLRPEFHSSSYEVRVILITMTCLSVMMFMYAFYIDWISMGKIFLASIALILVDNFVVMMSDWLVFLNSILEESKAT